jgi:hypothetical protein
MLILRISDNVSLHKGGCIANPPQRPEDAVPLPHRCNRYGELAHAPVERLTVGGLERYERPLPVMNDYDLLLDEVAEVAR